MANRISSLIGGYVPGAQDLSEDDKRAVTRQLLAQIGAGLLSARTGGDFGASLGQGVSSGLLAANRVAQDLGDKRREVAGGTGLAEFNALTEGLSDGDKLTARRVRLGLDPRAVTGSAKIQDVVGADNVTRQGIFDPATQTLRVFDGQQWVQAGPGGVPMVSTNAANGAPINIGSDIPPEVAAAIRANPDAAYYGTPQAPLPQANPGLFQSAPAQVAAGQVAGAQAAAALPYSLSEIDARKNAAIQQADVTGRLGVRDALDEAEGKRTIDEQAEAQKRQLTNASSLSQYEAAISGLRAGLSGAATNPVAGRLPAVTANQQIAEGGVAAMAPVLKQLFRAAGEGTFTDSDQRLLMEMIPNRMDLPAARDAKLANIDAIVRAKLGSTAQSAPARAPSEGKRLKFNPITGKIE